MPGLLDMSDDLRAKVEAILASAGKPRHNPAVNAPQIDGPAVTVPAVWKSAPNHPPTMLAYITPEEAELLSKRDLHNSGVDRKRHFGPGGVPSFNGYDGSGGYGTGGDEGGGGAAPGAGAMAGEDRSTAPNISDLPSVSDAIAGEDRSTAPNYGVNIGPNSLYGAQYGGWIGNRIGESLDRMAANPISSAINAGFGLIGGPLSLANTLSGWMGGPTVGSLATGAGRAAGAALGIGTPEGAAPTSVAAGPSNPGAASPGNPGGYDAGNRGGDGGTNTATPNNPILTPVNQTPEQVSRDAIARAVLYNPDFFNSWRGNQFVIPGPYGAPQTRNAWGGNRMTTGLLG